MGHDSIISYRKFLNVVALFLVFFAGIAKADVIDHYFLSANLQNGDTLTGTIDVEISSTTGQVASPGLTSWDLKDSDSIGFLCNSTDVCTPTTSFLSGYSPNSITIEGLLKYEIISIGFQSPIGSSATDPIDTTIGGVLPTANSTSGSYNSQFANGSIQLVSQTAVVPLPNGYTLFLAGLCFTLVLSRNGATMLNRQ